MHNLVPHFILENYKLGQDRGSISAVGMFVDISGFSLITDELMEHGQHGAEVLADVMRGIFSPLVQGIYEHGGFISTLAGDAFTAIFPLTDNPDQIPEHALSAVCNIQEQLEAIAHQPTPYGDFIISGKIGIAKGGASWGVVTSTDKQRAAYFIQGTAIEGSALAESQAQAGEILIDSEFHSTVQEVVEAEEAGDFYRVTAITGELLPPQPINLPSVDAEDVYRFFPQSLFHETDSGEFRQVVTMFINLPTVRTEDQLDIFMQTLFDLQDKFGGLLTRLDFGDKGSNLLIFWGAPMSFENDIDRALNLILDLQIRTSIPINAGITYQIAHAGFIGSPIREEYSTYGRGVNLAARFMSSAKRGELWIDEEIAKRAAAYYEIELKGEFSFKGFTQKQRVYLLEERKETVETFYQTDMVGRQAELKQMGDFIQPLSEGKYSGALVILGEPGIGKTRLAHEFNKIANIENPDILWAFCQSDQAIRDSLNPFRYWLRQYFAVSTYQSEGRNKRNFNRKLDGLIASLEDEIQASELDRTRSFLGALIELYWPDSLFEQLDPQSRYENTFIGLINLFLAESTLQPLILQIEDAQWLDNDSWTLLAQLDRTIKSDESRSYPISIIATARLEFLDLDLGEELPYQELRLGELSPDALGLIADQVLENPASTEVRKLLLERADGNPFFAEQILYFIKEEGYLKIDDKDPKVSDRSLSPLPDNIRALLVSRLDRLTQEVKEVVLTAAILGREFEVQLLSYMLDGDTELPDKVAGAEQNAIWSKVSELRYLFNQTLLHDAAYRMQVHSRRQVLHQSAVEAIEKLYPQELISHSTDLAYHCEMAGLVGKARAHLIDAANSAKAVYQNTQAVDHLTRALNLTPDDDYQARFELILERENLLNVLGKHNEQKQDLEEIEHLLDSDGNDFTELKLNNYRSKLAIRWADYKTEMGDYAGAIESVQEIIDIAEKSNLTDDLDDAYYFWSLVYYRQGKFEAALQMGVEGLDLANKIGDQDEQSRILNLLGLIALDQDRLSEAQDYFNQSLSLAKDGGNLRDQARSLNNLGIQALTGGNFSAAQEYYEQSLDLVRKIGDRSREGLVLSNLGYIAGIQGDYSTAREYNERSLQFARQTGNRIQEVYALINISSLDRALKEFPEALSQANRSLSIAREIGERNGEAWSLTSLGYTNIEIGDLDAAVEAFKGATELRQSMKQQNLVSEPLAGLARIALEEGDLNKAFTYINPILIYLDQGDTLEGTEEPVLIYLTCYQVLRELKDPRAGSILEAGYNLLQTRASGIKNKIMRNSYYEIIPHNRELLAEWKSFQED